MTTENMPKLMSQGEIAASPRRTFLPIFRDWLHHDLKTVNLREICSNSIESRRHSSFFQYFQMNQLGILDFLYKSEAVYRIFCNIIIFHKLFQV